MANAADSVAGRGDLLANKQVQAVVEVVVATLPGGQRTVVTLQDIEDLDSEEICALLDISDGSRRVQLHRPRARIRAAIEIFSNEAGSC